MEVVSRRKLQRQRVPGELGRDGLGQQLATGIERSRTVSTIVPCVGHLLELDRTGLGLPGSRRRRLRCRCLADGRCGSRGRLSTRGDPALEQFDAVRERLAGQVGVRPRHLHERELEREPRVAALAQVLDGYSEEIDQPEHGRLGKRIRLLAQELLRLLRDGQGLGHVAHVLHQQEVPQVLEQIGLRGAPGPAPDRPAPR
ncbi:MAG: hypothetical protein H0U00_04185 [Actinobacteria bacterium]|nr:hypothetical protein [Actinomycetota bacterium]